MIDMTPSLEQIARLAVNPNWTVDITDPRNALFLIPFSNLEREQTAKAMADTVYGAMAEGRFTDATSQADANAVYFQCLVDARRMLGDHDYMQLFC